MFARKPPKDFLVWTDERPQQLDELPEYAGWVNSGHNPRPNRAVDEMIRAYKSWVSGKLQKGEQAHLRLTGHPQSSEPLFTSEDLRGAAKVGRLTVQFPYEQLVLEDKEIGLLELVTRGSFEIRRCRIGKLYAYGSGHTLGLGNCWIGNLSLERNSFASFRMKGGGILDLSCPTPPGNNPFMGPVRIDRDVFAPSTRDYGLQTAQPYSSLKLHLLNLGNVSAASIFQRAELTFERQDDTPTNKVLGFLYWLGSDYGTSTGRPLLWVAAFYAAASALLISLDAILPPDVGELDNLGWRSILTDGGWGGRITRGALYSFQAIFNPLGIFGSRSLLTVSDWWVALVASGLCFLATLSLALFVLALRRRFRIS